MKELNKLANEIVSELVDCGAADEEPVEQYKKWTLQRLEKAFRALEQRAEAAEAKLADYVECFEAESARADRNHQKLAEYEKQETE